MDEDEPTSPSQLGVDSRDLSFLHQCTVDITPFGGGKMTVPPSSWKTMDAFSKCFAPTEQRRLSKTEGGTLSFAGRGMYLSEQRLKEVLWFFTTLSTLINDGKVRIDQYVLPSTEIRLDMSKASRPSERFVADLQYCSQMDISDDEEAIEEAETESMREEDSTARMISLDWAFKHCNEGGGAKKPREKSIVKMKIEVGFTCALVKKEGQTDEERIPLWTVSVTPPACMDLEGLINDRICVWDGDTSKASSRLIPRMKETWKRMLDTERYANLGCQNHRGGSVSDTLERFGPEGIQTILSPQLLPLKFNYILRGLVEENTSRVDTVGIIGLPSLSFDKSDDASVKYMNYVLSNLSFNQEIAVTKMSRLTEYWKAKPEKQELLTCQNNLETLTSWPIVGEDGKTILGFSSMPRLPVILIWDPVTQESYEDITVWISNVGGIPKLQSEILNTFVLQVNPFVLTPLFLSSCLPPHSRVHPVAGDEYESRELRGPEGGEPILAETGRGLDRPTRQRAHHGEEGAVLQHLPP